MNLYDANVWLPIAFAALLGFSVLIYSILAGFDLGVGILLLSGETKQKEVMLNTLSPFGLVHEAWLFISAYLLLVAFPNAQSIILNNLFTPATLMILGIIIRGITIHCRAKTQILKPICHRIYFMSSLIVALCHGYMLGSYILGFPNSLAGVAFALLVACCITSSYLLLGSCWLLMQTTGDLQIKTLVWARTSLWLSALGILLISLALLAFSDRIFDKWFSFPRILFLAPIPFVTCAMVIYLQLLLRRLSKQIDKLKWMPFVLVTGLFILCYHCLAYSFFPYIVPESMTLFEAASSTASLKIIFFAAIAIIPLFFCSTVYSYTQSVYR